MDELVAPPRRERRYRKKAVVTAEAARAAYGDVFGGPPRFAAPFAGVPDDYTEVFGGVAASCSIPYLDLPPAAARDGGGGGDYGEIFGQFDFGGVAVPYEELFAEAEGKEEEIASSSGSSRSSFKKEPRQLEAEPSIFYSHYPNVGCDQNFEEDQYSPMSSPDGEQHFSMLYNKTTRGRPDDLIGMTTCIVEPAISYVDDSCNLSHDSATNLVPGMDNGRVANEEEGEKGSLSYASASVKNVASDFVADQKQHMPICPPISENVCADENHQRSSSGHSASSEEAPSPDYPFLRASNSLQTRSIRVPPSSRPLPKLLNKKESIGKDDIHLVNHKGTPLFDSEISRNSAAAAAMKEAMEFAEARLKAAKELMERKGDSFKLRKRRGHHRSIKSTEVKESKTPEEVHSFEEKLSTRKLPKEERNYKDPALLDKDQETVANLAACSDNEKSGVGSCQASSKLEQLSKWTSASEFFELISHDRAAGEEDNGETTNPVTKLIQEEKKSGVTAGDLYFGRYKKLCEKNDSIELGVKQLNVGEDGMNSGKIEYKAPIIPEVSTQAANVAYRELHDSVFEEHVGADNFQESHDDNGTFESLCMSEIPSKLDIVQEMSSSLAEACTSEDHANDHRDLGDTSTEETPVVGRSHEDKKSKEIFEMPCDDDTPCTSERSKKLQEHPEVPAIDDSRPRQVKATKLEEHAESYESQAFHWELSTVNGEAETYETEKLFGLVNEACLQNEKKKVNEAPKEALIYGVEKFGTEEKADVCKASAESVADLNAGCSEKEADITLESDTTLANENAEAEGLNVSEGGSTLMESNFRKCGTFDKDPDQLQEMQGSLEPRELENRMDEGGGELVCHNKGKETNEPMIENSEKIPALEILNHGSQDDHTVSKTGVKKGPSHVYAVGNVRNDGEGTVLHSGIQVITDFVKDYAMRLSTSSKDLRATFSEACSSMQHLSQTAAESVSSQMSDKSTLYRKEAEREPPTEKSIAFEEEKKIGSKMEKEIERIQNLKLKDQHSLHLESGTVTNFAEHFASVCLETSREEVPGLQSIEQREDFKKIEIEIEKEKVFRRLEEDKEREQAKERVNRKLEDEEREREREKDRLAVERATREAHERAFAEARERAERIALERITAARQRATAETQEKEEKASAEAASEKASKEARIKAERAAVERATAEARVRAMGKAKAEKAAADARERRERYRSSFKDSFKVTNQDIRQDTQFHRTTSNNYGKGTDSCDQVVEVESALRHKARLERHQRTAERAAKALAEKNLRDLLAQREQAERHRLAEFLDPEVKRWSNGKEGNLRALLSTLQYILGADSGWQPIPLTDLIIATAVKKAYRRATLCVHPDKVQQRGATVRQKYICEKVFDLLKEAWNKFNSEER